MRKVKAGIIGTGFIGPAHVEAVRRLGFVEMAALCEKGQALAQSKADQLNIPKAYGEVDDLLNDPEIEVIHNCTPNHLHFEVSTKIIESSVTVVWPSPKVSEIMPVGRDAASLCARCKAS